MKSLLEQLLQDEKKIKDKNSHTDEIYHDAEYSIEYDGSEECICGLNTIDGCGSVTM